MLAHGSIAAALQLLDQEFSTFHGQCLPTETFKTKDQLNSATQCSLFQCCQFGFFEAKFIISSVLLAFSAFGFFFLKEKSTHSNSTVPLRRSVLRERSTNILK